MLCILKFIGQNTGRGDTGIRRTLRHSMTPSTPSVEIFRFKGFEISRHCRLPSLPGAWFGLWRVRLDRSQLHNTDL